MVLVKVDKLFLNTLYAVSLSKAFYTISHTNKIRFRHKTGMWISWHICSPQSILMPYNRFQITKYMFATVPYNKVSQKLQSRKHKKYQAKSMYTFYIILNYNLPLTLLLRSKELHRELY